MVKLFTFFLSIVILCSGCASIGTEKEAPRGIRNNNPGNIIKTDINWKGKVRCNDSRFECFVSAKYGIRAMAIILSSYKYKHGIDDVAGVFHRWAPPHENNTQGLINYVCSNSSDSSFNTASLIRHIIKLENGYNPYTLEEINNGIPAGDNYNVRFVCNRRGDEAMGDEGSTVQGIPDISIGSSQDKQGGQKRSKTSQRSGYAMDTKDNCYFFCDGDNCGPQNLCYNRPSDEYHVWMDSFRAGLSFSSGKRCSDVGDNERNCDNSPRHPPSERNMWAIFRGKSGWT